MYSAQALRRLLLPLICAPLKAGTQRNKRSDHVFRLVPRLQPLIQNVVAMRDTTTMIEYLDTLISYNIKN